MALKKNQELIQHINSFALLRLVIFADVINRFVEIELKDNINWLKTFALIILVTLGSQTLGELAKLMQRSNHSMTSLVEGLVQDGYVKRYHPDNNRRTLQVKITPNGIQYLNHTLGELENAEKDIRSYLDKDDMEKLISLTKTLRFSLIEKLGNVSK
jgi:DNA-binding MarR family transcriptional regulator